MNFTKNPFAVHKTFIWTICIALVAGVVFLITNHFEVLINGMKFKTFTFPNIIYWLLVAVGTILLPVSFLIPSKERIQRIQVIKYTYFIYGALYILTLTWIFPFIFQNPFLELFSNESITAFQSSDTAPMISSYALWDTYSWSGSLASLAYGAILIYVGINIDDEKHRPCSLMALTALLRIVFTMISNLICGNSLLSLYWFGNNYAEIISLIAVSVAMFLAAVYDSTWISLIWDHEVPHRPDDEE